MDLKVGYLVSVKLKDWNEELFAKITMIKEDIIEFILISDTLEKDILMNDKALNFEYFNPIPLSLKALFSIGFQHLVDNIYILKISNHQLSAFVAPEESISAIDIYINGEAQPLISYSYIHEIQDVISGLSLLNS